MPRLQSPILNLIIRNDLSEIGRIAGVIEGFCAEHGLSAEIAHAVNLALDELLTNTISYGYDDAASHVIEIVLAARDDRVTMTVRDDARAFDPTEAAEPDLDAGIDDRPIGGLGIHLVRTLMDEMQYSRLDGYNQVTLTKFARP